MRSFACVLLAVAASAGCGDSAASTILDAGRDASLDLDAGIGGAGGTGGFGGSPRCNTGDICPTCPDEDALCDATNSCPIGEVCLATGCCPVGEICEATGRDDLRRCFPIGGGACQDNEDCGDDYECNLEIGRCLRTMPGCSTSNDCVTGFACEGGQCVDRRVPCRTPADCPHGFTCRFVSDDQRFCRRITRPCNDDIDCLELDSLCGDVESDGQNECMPPIMPHALGAVSCDNSQCTDDAAPVCEPTPEGTPAECGRFGLCASVSDCSAGFECIDLWGDAKRECVLPGGSCVSSSECVPREVCATARSGGPPACVGGAAM